MNRWKIAFFAVLGVLVLSNAFWAYQFVDSAVSYTYLESSYDEQRRAAAELGQLIVKGAKNYTKADVRHLLRQAKPDAFIVDEADSLNFEAITFRFEADRLVEVRVGS